MSFDYKYINKSNPFAFVQLTLDGDFVCVDCDPTDDEIQMMVDMVDVEGWVCE
ncbi:hypothetical protein NVP1226O_58 [Vibrio phage 1.226.O._10N.261.48.E5]|nr:hypothetical protein NVP1226O_58 [Vibrio phage 1.226.O._10N.261.48.E5]